MTRNEISAQQAAYYGQLYATHGTSVDSLASGSLEYKRLRYEQLCDVIGNEMEFSLHDVGFGLGHLRKYISERFPDRVVKWSGSEVTRDFVDHPNNVGFPVVCRDLSLQPANDQHDYVVLAGTFYHLAGAQHDQFMMFLEAMVTNCWAMCRRGLAFNVVTDAVEYRKDDLFYPDIGSIIGLVRRLSRYFEIDHATPLYEYTVRVYREVAVSDAYFDAEYDKYLRR